MHARRVRPPARAVKTEARNQEYPSGDSAKPQGGLLKSAGLLRRLDIA